MKGDLDTKRNPLDVVGDEILKRDVFELGVLSGAALYALQIEGRAAYERIRLIKYIRDNKLYLQMEPNWEDFCKNRLRKHRSVVEHEIKSSDSLGPDYFDLVEMVPITPGVYRAMTVEDGCIIHQGEKISIDRKNQARVAEVFAYYAGQVKENAEELKRAKKALETAEKKAENAKQAATKAREELDAIKTVRKTCWEHVDQDGQDLLDIMSELQFSLHRLRSYPAAHKDLSEENQERYVAACEYVWAELTAVVERGRAKFGVGMLAPRADITQEIDDYTPNKRDIVAEYINKHVK